MRGTFWQGDVLLVIPIALQAVCTGDVIAFHKPKPDGGFTVIVHRVQARTAAMLITRGDNKTAPDSEPVRAEHLVGRVFFVQRDGRMLRVWGGRAGRLWVRYLRLRRRVLRLGRLPYRMLRASGVVRRLWRPRVAQVHLTAEDGPLVKYVHLRRTVACWQPQQQRFWCRKPYDLVIERPSLGDTDFLTPSR